MPRVKCNRCLVSYDIRENVANTHNQKRFKCELKGCTRVYREDTTDMCVAGRVTLYQTADDVRDTILAAREKVKNGLKIYNGGSQEGDGRVKDSNN